MSEFMIDLMENVDGQEVKVIGQHVYYNLDGKVKMSDWVRGELPKCVKSVCTTDGIKTIPQTAKGATGNTCVGALGYFVNNSNNVCESAQYVILVSLPHSHGHGFNLLPENFDRAVSAFAARKLVDNQWFNTRDCYMAPNVNHERYPDWQKDCFVFSMFHSASNQTSIKGSVDGEDYDFVNQFFPFSKKETFELLGKQWKLNSKDEERFVKQKLDSLTPEGQAVLDAFRDCLKASASARDAYSKKRPELQLNRWDAGWRQLKGLFAEACPEPFNLLKEKFKTLKDKMLPMVYELGFLKK